MPKISSTEPADRAKMEHHSSKVCDQQADLVECPMGGSCARERTCGSIPLGYVAFCCGDSE